MSLHLFFHPVPEHVFEGIADTQAFYHSLRVFSDEFPDYKEAQIALIGLQESRGAGENTGTAHAANEIRRKLYRLKRGNGTYKMVDLGNLANGVDLDESYVKIREVCSALLREGVLPVLLGGSHDLSFGQYMAYEDLEKLVTLLNVDAMIDMEEGEHVPANRRHLSQIFTHEPNYLFHFCHLGYQSYLVNPGTAQTLEQLYFEVYRLGQIRDQPRDMEPVVRHADLMAFDLTAVKSLDAPGNAQAQPFGLSGEEACQLCWYAGANEKLSSVGFYEYNPDLDDDRRRTASVVATMVWYFIEGFNHRHDRLNFATTDYLKYVVSMPSEPETLTFYKSLYSEKWWMEVPYPQTKSNLARNLVVPCGYSDYETANHGELPKRWIDTQAKLL